MRQVRGSSRSGDVTGSTARVHVLDDGGAYERVSVITGARGVGTTVLLNALERIAKSEGWIVLSETATQGFVDRLIGNAVERLDEPKSAKITGLNLGG